MTQEILQRTRPAQYDWLIKKMKELGISTEGKTIFEYGSTDLAVYNNTSLEELTAFCNKYSISDIDDKISNLKKNSRLRLNHLWRALKASEVDGADGDGYECTAADFNFPLTDVIKKQYDIVLNLGTLEHVFNIAQGFTDTHNLCKKNGYIVYALPVKGCFNHGFFNVQPKLFYDLAVTNSYDILSVYKHVIDDKGVWFAPIQLTTQEYVAGKKDWEEEDVNLFVFFRKLTDDKFKIPYEGKFRRIADQSVAQKYEYDKEYMRAKYGLHPNKAIAIFGTAKAGKIAYDFCIQNNIPVCCFIDDFVRGTFSGTDIPILNRQEFLDQHPDISTVLIGKHQAGNTVIGNSINTVEIDPASLT